MAKNSVSPSPRKEEVRDKNIIAPVVVQFDLEQIKEHFCSGLERIKKQFDVADNLVSSGNQDEAMDIWRAQVVFVEALFDFYIHEMSKYSLIKMFIGEWEKTASYCNFMIPMSTVEEGLKNPESSNWLLERLNKRFSLEVYLSSDALGTQLSLIGFDFDKICKAAFPKVAGTNYVKGQQRLKVLYTRRNQIAHQTDRKHATAERDTIDKEYVVNAISTIEAFVNAMHMIAVSK